MPRELAGEDEVAAPDEDIELPAFSVAQLRGCSNEALMDLLVTLAGRVPESVIRECASRGDEIVPLLHDHIRNQLTVEEFEESRWWGVLHSVHVLGLVPGAAAARALIEALEIRQADPDEYLWEWVSGYWPALFDNKREPDRRRPGRQRLQLSPVHQGHRHRPSARAGQHHPGDGGPAGARLTKLNRSCRLQPHDLEHPIDVEIAPIGGGDPAHPCAAETRRQ